MSLDWKFFWQSEMMALWIEQLLVVEVAEYDIEDTFSDFKKSWEFIEYLTVLHLDSLN